MCPFFKERHFDENYFKFKRRNLMFCNQEKNEAVQLSYSPLIYRYQNKQYQISALLYQTHIMSSQLSKITNVTVQEQSIERYGYVKDKRELFANTNITSSISNVLQERRLSSPPIDSVKLFGVPKLKKKIITRFSLN